MKKKSTYMAGEIVDPIFGSYKSDIYLAPDYVGLPNYFGVTPDSIVLIIDYDSIGLYGNPAAEHDLRVFRVREDFVQRDSIDSAETFDVDMSPLGTKSFVPNTTDSIFIADLDSLGEVIKIPAELRIPLDIALAEELLVDSMAALSDTLLRQSFKGFKIEASTAANDAMLAFDMSSNTGGGSIVLYYTRGDSVQSTFRYPFEIEVFSHMEQDYSGAPVEEFIGDESKGDSLFFLQAFRGLDAVFVMPDLSDYKDDRIINKVELIVTIAELAEDHSSDVFPPLRQLLASDIDEAGDVSLVQDLTKFTNLTQSLIVFDGRPATAEGPSGEDIMQYRINITDYARNLADEDIVGDSLILTPFFRQETPRNSVLYGPGHSTYPAKLRIVYTEL